MKIEIGSQKPEQYMELWPGQYEFFSHYEYAAGVPQALFLVTTRKENGLPNVCLHSWSAFSGDPGGFFVIMPGLCMQKHTYKNIMRDKVFCINFVGKDYYDAALGTIEKNGDDDDEFAAGGFTIEEAKTISAPRIKEAFLTYECSLEFENDLSGKETSALIIGRVVHAAADDRMQDMNFLCGDQGFMFNVHAPKNPLTGEGQVSGVAVLRPVRLEEE